MGGTHPPPKDNKERQVGLAILPEPTTAICIQVVGLRPRDKMDWALSFFPHFVCFIYGIYFCEKIVPYNNMCVSAWGTIRRKVLQCQSVPCEIKGEERPEPGPAGPENRNSNASKKQTLKEKEH